MEKAGYCGKAEVLDSKDWLPQRRRRVYMVFMLATVCGPKKLALAFENVEHIRVKFDNLSAFLCHLNAEQGHRRKPQPKDSKRMKWPKRTLEWIKKKKLSHKVLGLCLRGLKVGPLRKK